MKLKKAIEILREHVEWCDSVKEIDTYNALKLGIEALEHILSQRFHPELGGFYRLPGETKE